MEQNKKGLIDNLKNEMYEHEIISFCGYFLKDGLKCIGVKHFHKYQIEFLTTCGKEKRVAGLWARQSGKSMCIAAFSLYMCLVRNNYKIMIIAPTQQQSTELYQKLRMIAEGSALVRAMISSSTATEIVFHNNSRVKALPCGPEGMTIRGYTADTVIEEEAEGIKDSINSGVIIPMIASKQSYGQVIKIGTPKGKNHFYESCYGKETKYKLFHNPWQRVLAEGQYDEEFIDEQKKNLTELEFATEYEAKFIEDSDSYFKQRLIDACTEDYILGQYHPKSIFILGVDFARLGEDECVFVVVEKDSRGRARVNFIEATEHKKLTEAVGMIKLLDEKFGFVQIYLDETGMGAGPTDFLVEQLGGYRVEGITFSIKTKQDMYSNLKKMMEQGNIKFPPNRKLLYQMADLRYELTSTGDMKIHHSERGHDDYPDALALACWYFKGEGESHEFFAMGR